MCRKFYVIANSHIDPVWLWSRSSGANSWVNTMYSVCKIMSERPDLKFTASAAAMFGFIEKTHPALFGEIKKLYESGRLEIVGNQEVQPDMILSRPEVMRRQFEYGKKYFTEKFGKASEIGYCVDSFGHTGALPRFLNEAGMKYYVFSRPLDFKYSLFHWKFKDSKVLGLRTSDGYGYPANISKADFFKRFERAAEVCPLDKVALFIGVGDHGGGIYRKHLEWLDEAKTTYDWHFSTLSEYFSAINQEELPEFEGEIGNVFPGCYSACHQIKRLIAMASSQLLMAEKLNPAKLDEAWRELLFEHFHDIFPGTSIKEAYENDVFAGIGSVLHQARRNIDIELARLDSLSDTSFMEEGGVQIYNSGANQNTGVAAWIGFTDPNASGGKFNALRSKDGKIYPLQILPAPTSYGPCNAPWGVMTAVLALDANSIKYLGLVRAEMPKSANVGFKESYKLIDKIQFRIYNDASRTWGFGLVKFDKLSGAATRLQIQEIADGPVCSLLRTVYGFNDSKITMDVIKYCGIEELQIKLRLDWRQGDCALKMALSCTADTFLTGNCGEINERNAEREYPFVDFASSIGNNKCNGFMADDLHSCDFNADSVALTLLRPVRYADHEPFAPESIDGFMDNGRIDLDFWVFCDVVFSSGEDLRLRSVKRLNKFELREVTGHTKG